ncbi:hypothetical protein Goshw_018554, partial [Gossypium schwendimanii]|nr:hypothetical protein [Gossypium schwendimanii]
EEADVVLKAGDVLVNEINRVPSISFLTRVHQIMKESMARGSIQLMDIENDYYLVKFKSMDDYTRAIGSTIGHVIKIDYNTENGTKGKFAHMALNADLNKPLISKIFIDAKIHSVEYEVYQMYVSLMVVLVVLVILKMFAD